MTVTLAARRPSQLIAFTAICAALAAGSAIAGPIVKVKGEGAFLSISATDPSGCLMAQINVSRVGPKASQSTWMSYNVLDSCTERWVASGYGTIPNAAFKAANKSATLVLTPSSVSGFFQEGLTGSIDLTVIPNGVSSYTFSGHSQTKSADRVSRSHGTWTSTDVAGSGSVLGIELATLGGQLGESRDRYMELERGLN
jgi:hypothetical protein